MMKRIRLVTSTGLTCCLLLMGTGWVRGQQETRERDRTEVRKPETPPTATTAVRRISTAIGASVRLHDNARYGEVKDFVFNDNGCIDYVVIAYEDDYMLVPWTAATFDFEQRTVTIDIAKEKIRQLTFTKDHWPNPADSAYTGKLRTVFGGKAERREHRTPADSERGTKGGDRNNRDNKSQSKQADLPSGDRQGPDNKARDQEPAKDGRDDQPSRDRGAPKKPGDQKKPERADRPRQ